MTARTSAKDGLRRALALALRWRARLSRRPVGVVIVYHALAERHGDPARELVAPHGRREFRAQIDHLARHYAPVLASDVRAAAGRRRRGGRIPVAVTFDDDLRSHVEIAAPELRAAGVPAAFFLTGATLTEPSEFWWGLVQRAADQGLLEGDAGAQVAERVGVAWEPAPGEAPLRTLARGFESVAPAVRDPAIARLAELVADDGGEHGLRAGDVRALGAAGFDIGFHTRRHARLDRLESEAEVRAAVTDGRDEVAAAAGVPVETFSYPHGGVDARAASAVREAGYVAGFTSVSVAVTPGTDPALIGRFDPTYAPIVQFEIEAARWALT